MIGIYFSGTGNSKYCLFRFMNQIKTGTTIYSIEEETAITAISQSKDIIFAYPVYYSNLPKIVYDFIEQNHSLWAGKNIYIIATMGLFSGDGAGVAARRFRKHGANITGGLHLRMPDCIGDVKALKKPVSQKRKIIMATCNKIDKAAQLYLNGKPKQEGLNILYHLAGLFGQRLYFYNKTKHYTHNPKIDSEKCVGCKACEKICPMNNIQIQDAKAISGSHCTMCYRCFHTCSQKAITIIGKKVYEQRKVDI